MTAEQFTRIVIDVDLQSKGMNISTSAKNPDPQFVIWALEEAIRNIKETSSKIIIPFKL